MGFHKHSTLVIKDEEIYRKFKSKCDIKGEKIQDVIWNFIENEVKGFI